MFFTPGDNLIWFRSRPLPQNNEGLSLFVADISGAQPAIPDCPSGLLGTLVIRFHDITACGQNLAHFTNRDFDAVQIKDTIDESPDG